MSSDRGHHVTQQNPGPEQPIPISIVVEGVTLTGEIVSLSRTDMSVVILSPISGFGTGLHIPWYFGVRRAERRSQSNHYQRGFATQRQIRHTRSIAIHQKRKLRPKT